MSSSMEILVREPDRFSIWAGPPFPAQAQGPTPLLPNLPCTSTKFSQDGSAILVATKSGISVYDAASLRRIRDFEIPGLMGAAVSPCGTYVQSFEKAGGNQEKNVTVWSVESGQPVLRVYQKSMSKTTWPSIQFSTDESTACRIATNEIQFFDSKDLSKGINYKLRIPGVTSIELSKAPGAHVAAYVAESKGIPGSVQIYSTWKDLQAQPVARRSFFRCSSVQFSWSGSPNGGVLVVTHADVDKTNQSYYGETKLHYLTLDRSHEGLVPLRKEGPVHDVQWSVTGSEFAVVYGFMPAKATIFDKKCNVLVELGEGPYNTIRWNPKGRFICVAGFGNLPGHMVFWDIIEKKMIGATKAEWSVTSEWAPNGRYFMTATTAPRLQIDNCVKIFEHDGTLYFTKMFDKLYQAEWKPEAPEKFDEINDLVKSVGTLKIDEPKKQVQGSKQAQSSSNSSNVGIPKPAAYCPPHAKNAAIVKQELLGGAAPSSAGEMSKNALKNKKKREKLREKKAAEGGGNDN